MVVSVADQDFRRALEQILAPELPHRTTLSNVFPVAGGCMAIFTSDFFVHLVAAFMASIV